MQCSGSTHIRGNADGGGVTSLRTLAGATSAAWASTPSLTAHASHVLARAQIRAWRAIG